MTSTDSMQQLSAHDTRLLYADSAHANANISLLHIYDQRTAPGGVVRFKSILSRIEARLDRSRMFRSKLLRVPLSLDHPYWVDDEHFDLEYHVRHIALPKPGDWRQFCIQVSRIHARPLDLNRPLWEIYVIEGLDSFLDLPEGSFALLTKTHQVALDLGHGSELTELLHDDVAEPPANEPAAPWFPRRTPGPVRLVSRGLARAVTSPLRLAAPVAEALTRQMASMAPAAFSWAGELLFGEQRAPAIRFNSVVSAHRVFETRRFALNDFKTLRALADGATVNDCVLAVCAGGLRRYLQAHEELPDSPLSAIAPISIRSADGAVLPELEAKADGRMGDRPDRLDSRPAGPVAEPTTLSWLQLRLPTDLADCAERLQHIVAQTASSATVKNAIGARELTDIERHAPAATMALAGRMLGQAQLTYARSAPLANCTITNVPGSAKPLYLCGARMTYFSAMLPLADGMGLVIAVTSYDGKLIVSPTSCRELMPDPQFFAQCVRESFEEMLAAARALSKRRAVRRQGGAPAARR